MKRNKPDIKDVLKRPDASLVLAADGQIKSRGPHIHKNPTWFKKLADGSTVEVPADMTQPVGGLAVGATPTEVTPPLPSDIFNPTDISSKPLWGTGASPEAAIQFGYADCFYIAVFDSLLSEKPEFIKSTDIIKKRSDGKYVVTFRRNLPAPVSVVMDGVVSAKSSKTNYGSACIAIFEKAYAYYRTGANTYASIEWGWPGTAMSDLGIRNIAVYPQSTAMSTTLMAALAGDQAVCACTVASPKSGLMIGAHCYRVINVWVENGVTYFLLRNVWGVDGATASGDPDDGLVTLTLAQVQTDISAFAVSTTYPTDVTPWVEPPPEMLPLPNPMPPAVPVSPTPTQVTPMQITIKNKDAVLTANTSVNIVNSLAELRLTWDSDATSVRVQGGQYKYDKTFAGKDSFDTNSTDECTWTITFTKGTEVSVFTIKCVKPSTNTTPSDPVSDPDPIVGITTTYTRKSGAAVTKTIL